MWQHYLKAIVGIGLLLPAIFGDPERGLVRKLLGEPGAAVARHDLVRVLPLAPADPDQALRLRAARLAGRHRLHARGFVATVAVAAASWYLLERHAMRLGRRLSRSGPSELDGAAPAPSAPGERTRRSHPELERGALAARLPGLAGRPDAPAAEVIVVDNGSTDGSLELAALAPGVRVIELGRNTGFAVAANRGIEARPPRRWSRS